MLLGRALGRAVTKGPTTKDRDEERRDRRERIYSILYPLEPNVTERLVKRYFDRKGFIRTRRTGRKTSPSRTLFSLVSGCFEKGNFFCQAPCRKISVGLAPGAPLVTLIPRQRADPVRHVAMVIAADETPNETPEQGSELSVLCEIFALDTLPLALSLPCTLP